MPRKFASFRSIGTQGTFHLVASFWISALLSICHITNVNAMIPAVSASILSTKIEVGARHTPAAYCRSGYDCRKPAPTVQHHARNDPYDGQHDNGWYEQPVHSEPHIVTECEEGYEIVEVHPLPTPYHYDPYRRDPCGVRCWYRRLTSGYCGHGCEYYLYRIGKTRPTCRRRY